MGAAFRPADLVAKHWWDSPATVFDFDGIADPWVWATLRQWAMAPHLRAEIVRAARSCEGFARKYGCSVNHLRNMLNGHRVVDYPTMAMVLAAGNPTLMPSESDIAGLITNAFERASKSGEERFNKAPWPPASNKSHRIRDHSLDDRPDTTARRPRIHPDAEQIAAIYAEQIAAKPVVREYRRAHQLDGPPEIEITVFEVDDPGQQGADGFIAGNVIGGGIRVPRAGLARVGFMDIAVQSSPPLEDIEDAGLSDLEFTG